MVRPDYKKICYFDNVIKDSLNDLTSLRNSASLYTPGFEHTYILVDETNGTLRPWILICLH